MSTGCLVPDTEVLWAVAALISVETCGLAQGCVIGVLTVIGSKAWGKVTAKRFKMNKHLLGPKLVVNALGKPIQNSLGCPGIDQRMTPAYGNEVQRIK